MDLEEIVLQNERLIYSIISRYEYFYDKQDLYQVGVMGLIHAYNNYDASYGVKFSTYAYTYIRGEIRKFIREDRDIKVGKDIVRLSQSIDRAKELLSQKLMREPTTSELSCFLDIDESKILEAKSATEYIRSLDYCLNEDGKEMNLYDSIKLEEKQYSEDILDLHEQINTLDEKEKRLIVSRYFNDMTQSETARVLGMTQVQVCRAENKILTKMRGNMAA